VWSEKENPAIFCGLTHGLIRELKLLKIRVEFIVYYSFSKKITEEIASSLC